MKADIPAETLLRQLNDDIGATEVEAARQVDERAARAREAARANRRYRYLKSVRVLRSPAATFNLWPFAVLFLGSLVIGTFALISTNLLTGSFPLALFAFLLGIVIGVGILAWLLFQPPESQLTATLGEAESARRVANVRLEEADERCMAAQHRLADLMEQRRALMASGKVQRAALLQREWKTMAEPEWEDFVVEVCRTLGATVDRPARSSQPRVLIANFGGRRIVILTRGEGHVANSSTVQEAVAQREKNGGDACAVILNRRFTGAAQDFAARQRCALVGIDSFPDFVLGNTTL